MTTREILRLTGEQKLDTSHVLAEYAAIVVDPRLNRLVNDAPPLEPGNYVARRDDSLIDAADVRRMRDVLEKKSAEVARFFAVGGVMVIYGLAPTRLLHETARLYADSSTVTVNSHDWFVRPLALAPSKAVTARGGIASYAVWTAQIEEPFIVSGSGTQIDVKDPGHPFAGYLRAIGRYEARLTNSVVEWPHVTRLAENPAGEVVAAEFALGPGLALVVPPPSSVPALRALFNSALEDLLTTRLSIGGDWRLADEVAIDERWSAAQLRYREEREAISSARADVLTIKARVFESAQVKRVVALWDRIKQEGASMPRMIQDLYKLIEILEDIYGGERGLPDALGVDATRIKRAKRLANDEKYDLRHADAKTPVEPVRPPEVNDALEVGRELIQKFLDRRYSEEKGAKAP